MSRRAPRSRNTLRTARLLTCFLAASALIVGTVVPATVAAASVSSSVAPAVSASADPAATGIAKTVLAGFNAGNIISDAVFTNKNSMTEAQIQSFFNSKVSRCLGGRDENNEPIVCLKDFTMTTVTRPADAYCSGYTGAANESAARIIYRTAQACNINPQVLIVMLQKEQSLVTNTWPSAWRYRIALGQGCPDTAPCDPNYIGFFHQIYGAARQMQIYMEGKWFQWYAPGRTWNIQYNPNSACGSSPVYVANKATSALYYYTPYQPNAAALAAGYGAGNSCSAYGNRNFYNYFTDWFGSTQVPTVPALTSVSTSSFVAGVDSAGSLWGYPFAKGAWGERKQLASGLAPVTSAMMVGDLNGEGTRDLVIRQQSGVSLMRGNGSGFDAPRALNLDWSGVLLSTAAGDLDGDGIPDVITTNAAGDLSLWRGDDRGGLLPGVRIGNGWNGMNLLVGNVDLNRDGNPDLVGRDTAGRLWAYYGNGASGWNGQRQIGDGWGGMSVIFAPGDFSGDGVTDLLARTAAGDLYHYPGDGSGSIITGGRIGNGWQALSGLTGVGAVVTGPRALAPGAGDVDRDGALDVLALSSQGSLSLYRGNGTGGWRGSKPIGAGWLPTDRIMTLGDFTGDGYRDLGRITADGRFLMYPGSAVGTYGEPAVIGTGWQALSLLVGGVDFDGDRNTDVIGRNRAGQLVYYRGSGKGGWASSALPIGNGWSGFDSISNAGDFDGDGYTDLVVRSSGASLWLYSTNGAGGWGTARQIGQGWGGFSAIVGPGDFDGNGTADLITRGADNNLYLYRGDGRGGWGASSIIGTGWGGFSALG
ncbi:FG-GAP-like repeat-containing protein [Microbacterium sp. SA39]|uniref:FG-GAP-like repeat-containing protein n=1 Tax=Microbacterium sp. SA39 TaxID=1263625 RepID=UPI00061F08DA|nr:FG-GAP-like repeat-containing protein [Microbacterium sp. SA39]KJQ53649.1 FG-GAP repeat protein [Microbacterium sp. SA39]